MENFVEKPHPAFGGLPVCPFAKQARTSGRIRFVVMPLTEAVLPVAKTHTGEELLIIINPTKDGITAAGVYELAAWLEARLDGLMCFTGHPDDPFEVAGTRTRMEPYPNVQIVSKAEIARKRAKLRNTRYYEGKEELWQDQLT